MVVVLVPMVIVVMVVVPLEREKGSNRGFTAVVSTRIRGRGKT